MPTGSGDSHSSGVHTLSGSISSSSSSTVFKGEGSRLGSTDAANGSGAPASEAASALPELREVEWAL